MQLRLVHTGSVKVEPEGLRYPGEERGEQRGHVCHKGTTTNTVTVSDPVCSPEVLTLKIKNNKALVF